MQVRKRQAIKALGSLVGMSLFGTATVAGRNGGNELKVGGVAGIDNLRPFTARTVAPSNVLGLLLNSVYDKGIDFHPDTGEPVPWAFTNWEVVDTGNDVVVVASIRRDLEFSDGVELTAQDVVTSVELENKYGLNHQVPDEAEATQKYEVTYREIPDPPEGFLSSQIVPSHIWQPLLDNDGAGDYRPSEHGGPVGSGPFELVSTDFEVEGERHIQEFALSSRHKYPIPRDVDFLNNKGPFVNKVEVRVYPNSADLRDALKNEEVEMGFDVGGEHRNEFSPDDVYIGSSSGWQHATYNLRRLPFDDKPFRHMLAKVFDFEAVGSANNGVWVPGDLVFPEAFPFYRPFDPGEGPVERFNRPETSSGNLDVDEIREFLELANDKYNFTFEGVQNGDLVTGDLEIRVEGEPITAARNLDDRAAGRQHLIFLRNSAFFSEGLHEVWEQWIADLQAVGIPIEAEIISFDDQIHQAFVDEAFDIVEVGWANIPPSGSHLKNLFHSSAADIPDSDDNGTRFNLAGYTNADGLIDDVDNTFEIQPRLPKLEDALMQIYEDQPTLVMGYEQTVQVLSGNWTGWVEGFNRFSDQYPLLNIQRGNSQR